MQSAINYSVASRTDTLPWLSLLMLLCASVLLSGCKSYGPVGTPNFDPTFNRTLEGNEQLLFSAQTELADGTFMEGEEVPYTSFDGVLMLTNERMLFALWNGKQQRYEPSIWTGYAHITQVKMHNNILLQYIAIVVADGNKYTYILGKKSVDSAYAILMENIQKKH
jgi:hypothetical protein